MITDPEALVYQPSLFPDLVMPPPVSLADKFLFPPLSVLDRRSGEWQDRKRRWLSLGIQSEIGRDATPWNVAKASREGAEDWASAHLRDTGQLPGNGSGVSVFDPVVCELVYRWFCPDGGAVLDPFAGGSVRGITASILGRDYTGLDLSAEQVAANRAQRDLADPDFPPEWIRADAADMDAVLSSGDHFDLVFTCPPYGDLEKYSDDPRDLSAMTWANFLDAYHATIAAACGHLRQDRFAAIVVSEIRDTRTGSYRGFVSETIDAFASAGLSYINEVILVDPVGIAALFAEKQFRASRRMRRTHQVLLVFVKGDAKRAASVINNDAAAVAIAEAFDVPPALVGIGEEDEDW